VVGVDCDDVLVFGKGFALGLEDIFSGLDSFLFPLFASDTGLELDPRDFDGDDVVVLGRGVALKLEEIVFEFESIPFPLFASKNGLVLDPGDFDSNQRLGVVSRGLFRFRFHSNLH